MMRRLLLVLTATLFGSAAMLLGCGEEGNNEAAAETSASEATVAAAGKRTTKITLQGSDYGRVLFDGKGGALYLFTADSRGRSTCYDECAAEWPPFYARGQLLAGPGVSQDKLGKTTRSDGRKQVTYAGKPLYYWYRDPKNEILCHDVFEFGGDWLVVRGSGKPAR